MFVKLSAAVKISGEMALTRAQFWTFHLHSIGVGSAPAVEDNPFFSVNSTQAFSRQIFASSGTKYPQVTVLMTV